MCEEEDIYFMIPPKSERRYVCLPKEEYTRMMVDKESTCTWKLTANFDDPVYETECHQSGVFEDGGPVENNYKFCPYCGKKIVTDDADEIEADFYTSDDLDGGPEM